MKYRLSEHKDEIVTHIIKNLIWFPIAATIPLIGKLIGFIQNSITQTSQYITFTNVLIILCILLSICSIIICIVLLKQFNKPKYNIEKKGK